MNRRKSLYGVTSETFSTLFSDVLAAYASFLWKTEETTQENLSNTQVLVFVFVP